jgi:hypothetical protein
MMGLSGRNLPGNNLSTTFIPLLMDFRDEIAYDWVYCKKECGVWEYSHLFFFCIIQVKSS